MTTTLFQGRAIRDWRSSLVFERVSVLGLRIANAGNAFEAHLTIKEKINQQGFQRRL